MTTIINPLLLMENGSVDPDELLTDGGGATHRVILFDGQPGDGNRAIGWLVSTVSAVTEIPIDTFDAEGITDSPLFHGIIKQDNSQGLLIWLD
ncbi:MAG: hypothetical protein ACOCR6_03635 [archaeon]